jgi:hypothetical protein
MPSEWHEPRLFRATKTGPSRPITSLANTATNADQRQRGSALCLAHPGQGIYAGGPTSAYVRRATELERLKAFANGIVNSVSFWVHVQRSITANLFGLTAVTV